MKHEHSWSNLGHLVQPRHLTLDSMYALLERAESLDVNGEMINTHTYSIGAQATTLRVESDTESDTIDMRFTNDTLRMSMAGCEPGVLWLLDEVRSCYFKITFYEMVTVDINKVLADDA